jgi:hypothetical protein
MTRIGPIRPEFVEFIPQTLAPGVLYISRRYSTASHLCCCGCGLEVVTPLNPAKWRLIESNGAVSLNPSVGNWSFACQSHYWIRGNNVQWAGAMSAEQVAAVRSRDRRDVDAMVPLPQGLFVRVMKSIAEKIRGWFGR